MAKGQMRSMKEKKKPKADKDKPKQLSAYKLSQMQGSSASPYGNPPGKKSLELLAAHGFCFRVWRKLLCLLCHLQAGEQLHVPRCAIECGKAGAMALLCRVVLGPILLKLATRVAFVPLASRRIPTRHLRRFGSRPARPLEVEFRYGVGRENKMRCGQNDRQKSRHILI